MRDGKPSRKEREESGEWEQREEVGTPETEELPRQGASAGSASLCVPLTQAQLGGPQKVRLHTLRLLLLFIYLRW